MAKIVLLVSFLLLDAFGVDIPVGSDMEATVQA